MSRALREKAIESMNASFRVRAWQDQAFDQRRERGTETLPPSTRQHLMDNKEGILHPVLDRIRQLEELIVSMQEIAPRSQSSKDLVAHIKLYRELIGVQGACD